MLPVLSHLQHHTFSPQRPLIKARRPPPRRDAGSLASVPCKSVFLKFLFFSRASLVSPASRSPSLSSPAALWSSRCVLWRFREWLFSEPVSLAAAGSAVHSLGLRRLLKGGLHLQRGSWTLL